MCENHETLLAFWFGDTLTGGPVSPDYGKLWFGKDERVDAEIAQRFGPLLERADELPWEGSAVKALAQVVLLDQLPRNIFRGRPESFACDVRALEASLRSLELGYDGQVPVVPRAFFYLPLEHSEDLAMQERCVALFRQMLEEAPPQHRGHCEGYLDYAERHRVIIARFGRFPHRNAILGRPSTPEEVEFLRQPGSGF